MSLTVTQPSGPGVPLFSPETILLRASNENFPVALRILPRETRAHLLAIYGFARLSSTRSATRRQATGSLSSTGWRMILERAFDGVPEHPLLQRLSGDDSGARSAARPIFSPDRGEPVEIRCRPATRRVRRSRRLPCRHSRRIRWVSSCCTCFDAATPRRIALSDLPVCTALQLIEHWPGRRGGFSCRVASTCSEEDLERFPGVTTEELGAPSTSLPLRQLLAFEVERAAALLDGGGRASRPAPVVGRARIAIAGYIGGGSAAIEALSKSDYAVLPVATRPGQLRRVEAVFNTLRSES